MKLLLWLAFTPLAILADLIAFPVVPLVALVPEPLAKKYLSWFLTPDNPMTGDESHERRWAGHHWYPKTVAWLWRNRAYGFAKSVLGAKTLKPVEVFGDPETTDKGPHEGWAYWKTPDGYWQFYFIKKMPWDKVLRVNLGWKLWNEVLKPTSGMHVCTINPFKGYD